MSAMDFDSSAPAGKVLGYDADTRTPQRRKWQSLLLLSSVMFVVISNGTGIAVALPSIKSQLNLTDASLVWVTNAYLVTFAGALLLSGRLGDVVGHLKVFYLGLATFTLASLGCALSNSASALISARALQGIGGAAVSTATFSLLATIFVSANERVKAVGMYTFCCCMGGILGFVLSGVLISLASWRFLFVFNIGASLLTYLRRSLLSEDCEIKERQGSLDIWGAIVSTLSVGLTVHAILNTTRTGWLSFSTLYAFLWIPLALALFLNIESRVANPLVPLSVFRIRDLVLCCVVNMLYSTAVPSAILISLYFQRVVGHSALWGGFAFIPYPIASAAIALKLSARLIELFGIRSSLLMGLFACVAGFLLFARAPVNATYATDILPGLILLGVAAGMTYSSLPLAAISCLPINQAGLASGIITTSSTVGNALGFAILIAVADIYTRAASIDGVSNAYAINSGYHAAFLTSAIIAGIGVGIVLFKFPYAFRQEPSRACQ